MQQDNMNYTSVKEEKSRLEHSLNGAKNEAMCILESFTLGMDGYTLDLRVLVTKVKKET